METSIKKNFLYNAFYNILILILPLATTPYISRVMGADGVGIYSYASSIASYFGLFILLGLNNYGNRTIAGAREDKKKLSHTFWSIYAMQFFMSVLVIIAYLIYCFFIAKNQYMAFIQIIYLISVMLDINWFFFGLEQFKLTVTRNTIIKIINVILIFTFIKSKDDIYLYAIILVTGTLISQLILWNFLRKYISFSRVRLVDIFVHIKPNMVLFVPVIAISLYTTMSKILLGNMSSIEAVGYYESSNRLTIIPSMAITSLGTVMLPRMSNLIASGNNREAKKYIEKSLYVSVFLSSSIAFGISAVCKEFVPLFYGVGFEKCINIISILVLSSIFVSWANVIRTQYLIPKQKDNIYIVSVCLGALANICVNLLLIPKLEAFGAAIATLVAEGAVCIYQTYKVRRELKIKRYLRQVIPFIIGGISMYGVVINIPFINSNIVTIALKIMVGAISYLLICYVLLSIREKQFKKSISYKRRTGESYEREQEARRD